ncbi:unnamed protein product [Chondrus crispus]|uniref:Tc3 transposase DNA binding domain-containing protein n=1 Tax=Chondrus crispus TaxID=2769 RepID=R7Q5T1_CHOCR|nr:unnamed protein product [Chondrus crispus]CDF32825.1 unnamed protein product [Chondrus crispus]|eukprot:XP_005712626.1 unnamed protein product [Chondrus crispus]
MPRGKSLTAEEKGKTAGLHDAQWSIRRIAKHLGRSAKVVANYLKAPELYGTTKRSGRKPTLSAQAKRPLIREAHKGEMTSTELVKTLQLPVKSSRVRAILSSTPTLRYMRMARAPMILPRHKIAPESWARDTVTWTPGDWANVVWSDEKKFNLDGPDGFAFYWHYLRKDRKVFSKRQQGGDLVMVWGAFSGKKKYDLVVLEGKQNALKYIQTLETNLLPFVDQELGPSWTVMQDGAAVHRANRVYEWFEEEELHVMDWPAKSPDLNPIKNLLGDLGKESVRT